MDRYKQVNPAFSSKMNEYLGYSKITAIHIKKSPDYVWKYCSWKIWYFAGILLLKEITDRHSYDCVFSHSHKYLRWHLISVM